MVYRKGLFKVLKIFLAFVLVTIGLASFRILFKASNVMADNLVFYPEFCLGGWEKPQNASGQTDLGESHQASDFTLENSAYLESGVASQIFCGYFPIEEREKIPKEVTISFNWVLKNVNSNKNNSSSGASETPAPSVQESIKEVETALESPATSESLDSEPKNDQTSQPPEPVLPVENSGDAASVETLAPESVSPETPSPVEAGAQSFLDIFAKKVFAQENGLGEEFIDVSYSVDGIRWVSVGKVSIGNFRDYTVKIPINNWEDLKKIQIMLNVIPTVEEKPDIYLDGMSITVDYDRPFTEAAQEGLENTASAVVSALDIVGEKIISIVSVSESEKKPESATTKEPVIIKEKKLVFEIVGEVLSANTSLPWYSDSFRKQVKDKGFVSKSPNIKVADSGKSLEISGSCHEEYFVVLLWKNTEDYINHPGAFASNFADLCRDQKFSYDLGSISKETLDGDYFILIAEEDENNPWVPASGLIPIKISSVMEESVIEQ